MIRKTAIITGGFGDIGKATALTFAKNGYNVALTYLNTFDKDFINELKTYGIEVFAMHCDQSQETEVINFVNSVFSEYEYVTTLVANAGKAESPNLLTDKETSEIDEIISINLRGTILMIREVLKHFLSQKHGNIVCVSSIYANTGGSLESVYSATKGGIASLAKSLATEVAPFVRVNAVAPGCIETKMTSNLSKCDKECIISSTPLERLGTPEDVANAIYFLASDQSSFITGEVLNVTGGVIRF